MNGLPAGWAESTLGEVTSDCKQTVPSKNEFFTYIDISSVDRETKRITSPKELIGSEAPSRARKVLREGDVLVSMTRPNLNAVAIVPRDLDGQIASTGLEVLRPLAVDPRWIFYAVRTMAFIEAMSGLVQGALYPAVRAKDIRGYGVPVAPLTEQTRIADKLDGLLARVDTCRERLDCVPTILKSFRQSVLAAAASGELTREWRETRERKFEWSSVELRDVCNSISDGDHQAPPKAESGVPFITISAINTGVLKLDEATRFVPDSYFSSLKPERRAQLGDILLSVTGSIGITALVDQSAPFVFQRHIALLRPNLKLISSKFLFHRLSANDMKRQGAAIATGTAQRTIPLGGLRSFSFLNPPLDEQDEIARRLGIVFDLAARLEVRCQFGSRRVDALTPSLLSMAFRGELVPQDPTDEPAEALVERLQLRRNSPFEAKEQGRKRASGARNRANAGTKMLTRNEISPNHLANLLKEQGALTAEALWSASQLEIDDFYDQLKYEEHRGFLRENRGGTTNALRLLESVT